MDEALILTADPDFLDLALAELQTSAPAAQASPLAEGVMLISAVPAFLAIAETWRVTPPIFVRHICPVQVTVGLRGKRNADLAIIRQTVTNELLALLDPTLSFSVQTRVLAELPYKPFDLNNLLAEVIQTATGAPLDVRAPQQVLSLVCAQTADRNPSAYLGVSLTIHNLSDWAGGMRRFAREQGQVSRAEFKLLEALEVFQINLPPRGVALDLGAAPGGWTRVLRQHEQYVTAVDPGELDPRVAQDRGVRHKRMTAEAYLADDPDRFDLIVNDMRMDARDSARLMVSFAPQLYREGIAIMTLKLPEENRRPLLDHALKLLQQAYTIAGARQLFHNRSEVTLYLKPLAAI
ncbi:MAG: SAM-dependent methyltransferase [Caldilineaceae bacterium]